MTRAILLLLVVLTLPGYGLMSLNRATGARPIALGNAYVAMSDDAAGLYVNPAALASLKRPQFTSLYTSFDPGYSFASLGGVWPNNLGGSFGLGFKNFTIANITTATDVFDLTEQELLLAFARQVNESFSLGGDLRVVSQKPSKPVTGYSGANGQGSTFDLSAKYQPQPWLGFGAALQNVAGKVTYTDGTSEDFPLNFIAGTSLNLSSFNAQEITLNLDFSKESGKTVLLHSGVEWWPVKTLAMRFGLDQSSKNQTENYTHVTAGLGLKISDLVFDYAVYKQGDATGSLSHYFSLGYTWPAAKRSKSEIVHLKLMSFTDVPDDYWAKIPIEYLATLGILGSYPDGTFRPEQPVSRAEMVLLLVHTKDYPAPEKKRQIFSDVPTTYWAAEGIQTAYENKLALGYPDRTFRPRNNTTRAEGVTFLTRFEGLTLTESGGKPFKDVSNAHWAFREILSAKEDSLLNYLTGQPFKPAQSLTRAELAEILFRTKTVKSCLQGFEFE